MPEHNLKFRGKIRTGIIAIFALLLLTAGFDAPSYINRGIDVIAKTAKINLPHVSQKPFRLGLDLQGGAHLVYQADIKNVPTSDHSSAVEGVREVIEKRVNAFGVSEANVQTSKVGDKYRLIVELPGVTDTKAAIASIGETPILEFREQNNEPPRELTAEEKKSLDEFNKNARKKVDEVLKKLKVKTPFTDLAKEYSEDEESKNNNGYLNFVTKYGKYPEFFTWARMTKEGETSRTLVTSTEGYNLLLRGKEKESQSELKASHILVCYFGARNCADKLTKEEAKKKAEEIFKSVNDKNFADMAKQNSTDLSTKEAGGDLGVLPPGVLVTEFETALKTATVGQIIGPVETEFGFHIIYKTGEEKLKEYEVSRVLVRTKSVEDILPPSDPWKFTGLSGKQLRRAEVVTDANTSAVQVSLQFDEEGTKLFEEITRRNIQKPVAIFLDKEPISIPTVNDVISGGQAVISGNFTFLEAKLLAQRLNTGALPVPIELVSQQTVGASLGAESLAQSLKAGIIGLILVMIFMVLYYRLPGFIAVIALALYVSLTLAISKLLGITLTLSGITGLILSIGMAVDGNILIFERLKEELRGGKSLKTAVHEGFARAWTSIYDGNVATIITALLLLAMNVSFVKGFAITLTIGTLVSMFTAITVTRVLLQFVVMWFEGKSTFLFLGAKNNKE